jgi:protein required for attachment to host cells
MTPKRTWIVVADGAHARIATVADGALKPTQPFEFAAPHAPNRRFISDRPGAFADRGPGAHSYTPKHERRQHEKVIFARDVATFIDAAAEANRFDRLILVAPPSALGRLRAMLQPKSRARIVAQLGKDLIHLSLPQLQRHLVAFARG